jgi:hypothetical protein
LSRLARFPFFFTSSDLAALFLLLNAAHSDPLRFASALDFLVAF